MSSSHAHFLSDPTRKEGNGKYIVAGVLALSAVALASFLFLSKLHNRDAGPVKAPEPKAVAELVSASGMIAVEKAGSKGWHPVEMGALLMEGDLVQTDESGTATIRYSNGVAVTIQASTIFTVRKAGDGSMEISVPSGAALVSNALVHDGNLLSRDSAQSAPKYEAPVLNDARKDQASLFIKLDRIIPFGRSLELIGSVEAGSRLVVNNEIVDVAGDGSFKHFTNPFPVSARRVNLVMRVSDLAGRTRIVTTTYDFGPQDGND
ncbi:MAG: hypothetical protein JXA73_21560 [Acidobacteria bacterium]|nr:hypothetical protein [Acidobacteriota bacterium]